MAKRYFQQLKLLCYQVEVSCGFEDALEELESFIEIFLQKNYLSSKGSFYTVLLSCCVVKHCWFVI